MPIDAANWWQFFAVTLSSILFPVDPLATIPAFLVMTEGHTEAHRKRMAKRAAWTCFFVLGGFGLIGAQVFKLLGILPLIGIDMVQAKRPSTNEAPGEAEEGASKADVGIIPLGMPMLAGPGAIFIALAVTALSCYWVLKAADGVRRYMGETGTYATDGHSVNGARRAVHHRRPARTRVWRQTLNYPRGM